MIDFARSKPRSGKLAIALAMSGIIAILISMAYQVWILRLREAALISLNTAQSKVAHNKYKQDLIERQLATKQQSQQEPRWLKAVADMRAPWALALGAVEVAARPPSYVLALRMDPSQNILNLDAVAPNFDQALKLLTTLHEQPAIKEAVLVSRESVVQPTPGEVVDMRFSIRARWRQP